MNSALHRSLRSRIPAYLASRYCRAPVISAFSRSRAAGFYNVAFGTRCMASLVRRRVKTEGLGSGGEFDWSGRLGGDVALSVIGKGYGGKIEDIKNTDQGKRSIVDEARIRRGAVDTGYGVLYNTILFPILGDSGRDWIPKIGRSKLTTDDRIYLRFHDQITSKSASAEDILDRYKELYDQGFRLADDTAVGLVAVFAKEGWAEEVIALITMEGFTEHQSVDLITKAVRRLESEEAWSNSNFPDQVLHLLHEMGKITLRDMLAVALKRTPSEAPSTVPPAVQWFSYVFLEPSIESIPAHERYLYGQITQCETVAEFDNLLQSTSAKMKPFSAVLARYLFCRLIKYGHLDKARELVLNPSYNPPNSQVIALLGIAYLQRRKRPDAYQLVWDVLEANKPSLLSQADIRAGIKAASSAPKLLKIWRKALSVVSDLDGHTKAVFVRHAGDFDLDFRNYKGRSARVGRNAKLKPEPYTTPLLAEVCKVIVSSTPSELEAMESAVYYIMENWIYQWRWPDEHKAFEKKLNLDSLEAEIPYFAVFLAALPLKFAERCLNTVMGRITSNTSRAGEKQWPLYILWPLIGSVSRVEEIWANPRSPSMARIEIICNAKGVLHKLLQFRDDEQIAGAVMRVFYEEWEWRQKTFQGYVPEVPIFVKTGILPRRLLDKPGSFAECFDVSPESGKTENVASILAEMAERSAAEEPDKPEELAQHIAESVKAPSVRAFNPSISPSKATLPSSEDLTPFLRAIAAYTSSPIPLSFPLYTLIKTLLDMSRFDTAVSLLLTLHQQNTYLPSSLITTTVETILPHSLPLAHSLIPLHPRPSTSLLQPFLTCPEFLSHAPQLALHYFRHLTSTLPAYPWGIFLRRPDKAMYQALIKTFSTVPEWGTEQRAGAVMEVVRGARRAGYKVGKGGYREIVNWFRDQERRRMEGGGREQEYEAGGGSMEEWVGGTLNSSESEVAQSSLEKQLKARKANAKPRPAVMPPDWRPIKTSKPRVWWYPHCNEASEGSDSSAQNSDTLSDGEHQRPKIRWCKIDHPPPTDMRIRWTFAPGKPGPDEGRQDEEAKVKYEESGDIVKRASNGSIGKSRKRPLRKLSGTKVRRVLYRRKVPIRLYTAV